MGSNPPNYKDELYFQRRFYPCACYVVKNEPRQWNKSSRVSINSVALHSHQHFHSADLLCTIIAL